MSDLLPNNQKGVSRITNSSTNRNMTNGVSSPKGNDRCQADAPDLRLTYHDDASRPHSRPSKSGLACFAVKAVLAGLLSALAAWCFKSSGSEAPVNLELPDEASQVLGEYIQSVDSPVGIDAKKTHILILHKLIEIERRLDRLETRLAAFEP